MSDAIKKTRDFSPPAEQLKAEFNDDEITKKLNVYYSNEKAEIDPIIFKMATLSLPDDEW